MLSAENYKPGNQLLNALPPTDFRELQPNLKRVEMPHGKVLYNVGEPIDYIYFPENSIVSTVSFFEDGASIETGITGREGMTGFGVALSNDVAQRETSVQAEGYAWQMPAKAFQTAFERGGTFHHFVLRYVYAYLEQISQSGACINHHPVNQRLARWLLMCHDRAEGDQLQITHDFIAQMLGVNRPSVTGAAIELKDKGLIKYSRGVVQILDRPGLEAFSCECYDSIRRVYERYLSVLELGKMNERLDHLNGKMSDEMSRRERLQNTTHQHIQRLRNVVGEIKNISVPQQKVFKVRVCGKCQRICNFRNHPQNSSNGFLGKPMNTEFVPVICWDCR